jgi:hypothetical protein
MIRLRIVVKRTIGTRGCGIVYAFQINMMSCGRITNDSRIDDVERGFGRGCCVVVHIEVAK